MGDIIKTFRVRTRKKERGILLQFYFDTGLPRTFIRYSVASSMKGLAELPDPELFHGFGDGQFVATHIVNIEVNLLNLWVPHICYVVSDATLDPCYDILLGHDFMQIYDIQVKPKKKTVVIDKEALRMALKVRTLRYKA
ncbi:MAG: hypothetical protein HY707_00880 [Ignavibacteriae bacterium]|nr:hypothetical protein [Ignavibacteriota bacterium]